VQRFGQGAIRGLRGEKKSAQGRGRVGRRGSQKAGYWSNVAGEEEKKSRVFVESNRGKLNGSAIGCLRDGDRIKRRVIGGSYGRG
jgi:hypothetical protein